MPGPSQHLCESRRFTDRRALDEYLAPFIREGVLPIGAIEGYKWRVIRQQQLPDDYLRR